MIFPTGKMRGQLAAEQLGIGTRDVNHMFAFACKNTKKNRKTRYFT